MAKRKWRTAATVAVPEHMNGDELIWWRYSLCLLCNRHVPEYFTDAEVSSALNKMAARMPLPSGFEI
ncbi:MAG TPA: hypothetical protein VMV59_07005 [Candidatus Dormibacteraeota bacterium]|nr:hypothetical protein [Candidatus Dormibacteraeota bacterium]